MKTLHPQQIIFEGLNIYQKPFKHIFIDKVLSIDLANQILQWLKQTDLFINRNEFNNKSNEFIIKQEYCPENLKSFFSPKTLKILKDELQKIFEIEFEDNFILSAVKHNKGDGTSIHSDYAEPTQRDNNFFTHRFLIYLNENWEEQDGGMLGIFSSKKPSSLIKTIPPIHNTGVGISFGKNSYHAVGKIKNKNRFSLVLTLKAVNGIYEEEN